MQGKKRCRMHGGKSPGAPKGKAKGNYSTGCHTSEAVALRKHITQLSRWVADVHRQQK
ncbi:hypothetical protein [Parvularcula oceani]|uniref:hypothetical protein n=1 Tax=Parvularcula oceani TaxID=1247963 RepID=UPI003B50C78A